ncbi:hypothetical protein QYM46_13140 [Brevibacterium sp. K11IcPPYGO002]|uniref:hypothetical protein n=1 Tax=Brevibacterium sp. K11IcPPYGO002 TaxID=3058837 RepID=UPI003D81672A
MDLLRARAISRDPDDGVQAVYECQSCYRTYEGNFDPWHLADTIPCTYGCPEEEDDE